MTPEDEALELLTKRPLKDNAPFSAAAGQLLTNLESPDTHLRTDAVAHIHSLCSTFPHDLRILTKAVALLFAALSDGHTSIRRRSLAAIASVADQVAPSGIYFKTAYVDVLLNMLHENDTAIQSLVLRVLTAARLTRVADLRRICAMKIPCDEPNAGRPADGMWFQIGQRNAATVVLLAAEQPAEELHRSLLAGAASCRRLAALLPPEADVDLTACGPADHRGAGDGNLGVRAERSSGRLKKAVVAAVWDPHLRRLFARGMWSEVLRRLSALAHFVERSCLLYMYMQVIRLNAKLGKSPGDIKDAYKRKAQCVLGFPDLPRKEALALLLQVGFPAKPTYHPDLLLEMKRASARVISAFYSKPLIEGFPRRLHIKVELENVKELSTLRFAIVFCKTDGGQIVCNASPLAQVANEGLAFTVGVPSQVVADEVYLCLVDQEVKGLCRLAKVSETST